jgi:lipopolysaccharide transport system permease protein
MDTFNWVVSPVISTQERPWLVEIDIEAGISRGRPRGLRGIWQARGVLVALIARDLTSRYRRTVLGALWAVLYPAIFTVIISIAHPPSGNQKGVVPFPVYVYSGFVVWSFFSSALQWSSQSVVGAQGLVSASYFPRHVLPWAAVGLQAVDLLIGLTGLGALMAIYQVPPSPRIVALPFVICLLALAAGGIGTFLGGLLVVVRDIGNLTPFLSLAWLFATPAMYVPASVLATNPVYDSGWRSLLVIVNPLSGLLDLLRACLFGGSINAVEVLITVVTTLTFAVIGHRTFARFEARFTDVL